MLSPSCHEWCSGAVCFYTGLQCALRHVVNPSFPRPHNSCTRDAKLPKAAQQLHERPYAHRLYNFNFKPLTKWSYTVSCMALFSHSHIL